MEGRLLPLPFSGPARCSLTLRPASSLSRRSDPLAPKALTVSLPPPPLRLLSGWNDRFAGWVSHPRDDPNLCTAHVLFGELIFFRRNLSGRVNTPKRRR